MTIRHCEDAAEFGWLPLADCAEETPPAEDANGPDSPAMLRTHQCGVAIHETVVRLLEQKRTRVERRWSPRVPFVQPAWVCLNKPEDHEAVWDRGILVVTSDISFEGVGVISWQRIPVQHVFLQLWETCFVCKVCWGMDMGHGIYRYGLHFLDLVNLPE